MKDKINTKIEINIEINDTDSLSELTNLSIELGLSLDEFIMYFIKKLFMILNLLEKCVQ